MAENYGDKWAKSNGILKVHNTTGKKFLLQKFPFLKVLSGN